MKETRNVPPALQKAAKKAAKPGVNSIAMPAAAAQPVDVLPSRRAVSSTGMAQSTALCENHFQSLDREYQQSVGCRSAPLKWSNPMRASRIGFSKQVNPWMASTQCLVTLIRQSRWPVADANPYLQMERHAIETISTWLDAYRKVRDATSEQLFAAMYDK